MFYTYAIKSLSKNYIYVGITNNLDRRFKEHNDSKERTTRSRTPYRLIYREEFKTRMEARKKEIYLKSGTGKEFLKNIT